MSGYELELGYWSQERAEVFLSALFGTKKEFDIVCFQQKNIQEGRSNNPRLQPFGLVSGTCRYRYSDTGEGVRLSRYIEEFLRGCAGWMDAWYERERERESMGLHYC